MIADALTDFATAPEHAVMIGDRHFDIAGARANGVRGIGAAWGFGSVAELDEAGAHAIAYAPEELAGLLAPDRNAGAVVV
jgi:phosphoglycolate phosphatase